MSHSLRSHELQHTRLSCPSLFSGVSSDSCPLSWWCYITISSSVVPFSSCPQSFWASGSFPMSQLFPSGIQSIGDSASVLPMIIQDWFPLGYWFDLLTVQGTVRNLFQHLSSKASILQCSAFLMVQLLHLYITTGKIIALTRFIALINFSICLY